MPEINFIVCSSSTDLCENITPIPFPTFQTKRTPLCFISDIKIKGEFSLTPIFHWMQNQLYGQILTKSESQIRGSVDASNKIIARIERKLAYVYLFFIFACQLSRINAPFHFKTPLSLWHVHTQGQI